MSKIPSELRYSKDHEWVRIEGDLAYVGITDYAQDTLGEVVYVELPSVGEQFAANDEIANIESVKAASAIYNPIAGTVASLNEELDASPELINEDSYEHYLYTLKDFNASDLDDLLDSDAYGEFLKTLD
ncbi:glycine cleavage system protein GcvH [Pleomorphochaeta sp. DL1XJH-081]|jgi:glycine cleavage system H protein|uniref:glycine cleavage system protein GcvH n=1 Tax=Pleomorphochaeta sp. DL1XJH-081 TaxID=3409690 RepID=UPI003BB8005D